MPVLRFDFNRRDPRKLYWRDVAWMFFALAFAATFFAREGWEGWVTFVGVGMGTYVGLMRYRARK